MKKLLAAVLSLIMLASTVSSVMAEGAADTTSMPNPTPRASAASDDKALEQVIVTVKSRITIPEEYETFNFSKYSQYGRDIYNLSWERNDGTYGYISATVAGNIILGYNNYKDEADNQAAHFAKMSVDALYSKANSYIKKLNPDIYKNTELDMDSYNSGVSGSSAYFGFARKEGGIYVNGDGGNIRLNKDTGELLSFDMNWAQNFKGKDTSKLLNQSQIKEQFSKLIGLEPFYYVTKDKEGNKKAVLLYRSKNNKSLDALSGKVSAFESNYYGGYYAGSAKASEGAYDEDDTAAGNGEAGRIQLSPAEIKAVESEKGLITSSAAVDIVFNDKYNAIDKNSAELTSSYLNKYGEDGEKFMWSLSFSKKGENYSSVSASVDAETGKIISYYLYSHIPYDTAMNGEKAFTEKTSDSNVKAALKSYLGDKYSEYKLESGTITNTDAPYPIARAYNYNDVPEYEEPDYNVDVAVATTAVSGSTSPAYPSEQAVSIPIGKSYTYRRYVNGIKVDNDYINVQTNFDGKLTSFNYNYSDVKFPSAEKILSQEKALAALYKKVDLNLGYSLNISNTGALKTALLYTMPSFNLDAFTGALVNMDGTPVIDEKTGYSDLDGHAAKAIVEKLLQNGISLPAVDGKLLPDSKITESDFITLVSRISTDWNDFYNLYQKKLHSGEKLTIAQRAGGASGNKVLKSSITRQEAVKCIIVALGGKKFAEIKGVYTSPYKDLTDDSEYTGYFALAGGMGIVKANAEGNVRPMNTITRAQALAMIYSYLNNNK